MTKGLFSAQLSIKSVSRKLVGGRLVLCLLFVLSSQGFAEQASLNGNVLVLPVVSVGNQAYRVELSIVEDTDPIAFLLLSGDVIEAADLEGASSFSDNSLSVPLIVVGGISYWLNLTLVDDDPIRFVLADVGVIPNSSADDVVAACVRPAPDISHGPDNPTIVDGASVPRFLIIGGGPGPDGIPAIEKPVFTEDHSLAGLTSEQLVIGVKIGDEVRAYPHDVMDWHEIVNDQYIIDGESTAVSLNYCPLTGSAMLWEGFTQTGNSTFGTSGLLYNSNLVLYDRQTETYWSQMLEQAIEGPELLSIPRRLQVVETTWDTWSRMYPETKVLTRNTGFGRFYGSYPYGSYKTDSSLLFGVANSGDQRLHRKERVLGINVGSSSKVYPVDRFASNISVINDRVGDMDVVATGSSGQNFAVVFNRQLEDCTVLEFTAVQNQLPMVMLDNEGGGWDVFGTAISGPRIGTQLQKTNSYIAYWFAWTAFFPNADIHQ